MKDLSKDHEAELAYQFRQLNFMTHLGIELVAVKEGYCQTELKYFDELSQQNGFFHGGVVGTLADNVAAMAAVTMLPKGQSCLTAEYKINFLRPAVGDRLTAEARVIKPGRSLSIVEADVYAHKGEKRSHCATALVTLAVLQP